MRVREQIAGILIVDTNDVQVVDSKIERLQAKSAAGSILCRLTA